METQTAITVLSSHFPSAWVTKYHQNNALPAPVLILLFVLNQERSVPRNSTLYDTVGNRCCIML